MQTVGSREQVFSGQAKHTSGGLTKSKLMKNKQGKVVSKKMNANGKKLGKMKKSK